MARDRATSYAEQVVSGEIVTGPYVRRVCVRHLERIADPGPIYRWEPERCEKPFNFFEMVLSLSGGQVESFRFELLPWQAFVVGSLFGWVERETGYRQYRKVFLLTAKGSGKTPLIGGLSLYMLLADGEHASEGYVCARNSEQAGVTFRWVQMMISQSELLRRHLKVIGGHNPRRVFYEDRSSMLVKLASDTRGRGHSGMLPHFVGADEYHEHQSSAMLDMLEAGTKSRKQPLVVVITNAGDNMESPCGLEYRYACHVAGGECDDDSYFPFICGLDDEDDPMSSEECWVKANPSLPVTPGYKYLRQQAASARGMPSKRGLFERLNMCRWTDIETAWISREAWEASEVEELPDWLAGYPCYMGLDLSQRTDLTALALVWVVEAKLYVKVISWTPKQELRRRAESNREPLVQWVEQGYLKAMEGNGAIIDYKAVAQEIIGLVWRYWVQGIAYDAYFISQVAPALEHGGLRLITDDYSHASVGDQSVRFVRHPQGWQRPMKDELEGFSLSMPDSIDKLESRLINGDIIIERNPVLRYAVLGAQVEHNAQGARRFNKARSRNKIDALVAMVMGVGYADNHQQLVRLGQSEIKPRAIEVGCERAGAG